MDPVASSGEPFAGAMFSRNAGAATTALATSLLMSAPPRLPVLLVASLLSVSCLVSRGRALAPDPFLTADVVDEIGLARCAEEVGDAALRARLLAPLPRQSTLVAIRASPHARAPESLLVALAALACGRDPVLAPEAARATLEIASQLSASTLGAREVLKSDLVAAHASLTCREPALAPRADIAAWLTQARAALEALLR